MDNTIITCATQVITTLLTILASVGIAYFTFQKQAALDQSEAIRRQQHNQENALELFRAYIANLVFFTPDNMILSKKQACLYLKKLAFLDSLLNNLSELDLPDTFINNFQYYRIELSFLRIILDERIQRVESNINTSEFLDLELSAEIAKLQSFIDCNSRR